MIKRGKCLLLLNFHDLFFPARQMNFSLIAEHSDTIYDGKR